MKKLLPVLVILVSLLSVSFLPSVALAAKPTDRGGGPKNPPSGDPELVGYDVSYPQCGKRLPNDHYFAIVGVNGGLANRANPCLADQLEWAYTAKDGSKQPKVQLYVNTANPGEVIDEINTWPISAYDDNGNLPNNPYGDDCDGTNDKLSCSWLYGWNRSIYTEGVFVEAAGNKNLNSVTKDYIWWLDVETMNTWQAGSAEALAKNIAALEGFAAYYDVQGANLGLYSTADQWREITGNLIQDNSVLNGLPNWRPSGASLANAISNCKVDSLTGGGRVVLTQYIKKNLDHNHSCL